jgi:hypothetical protein
MCLQRFVYINKRKPKLHTFVLTRKLAKLNKKFVRGFTKPILLSDTNKIR